MQVLVDTLYRPSSKAPVKAKSKAARNVSHYARMGSGRSLAARVRAYFAHGWTLYADNARAAAPLTYL